MKREKIADLAKSMPVTLEPYVGYVMRLRQEHHARWDEVYAMAVEHEAARNRAAVASGVAAATTLTGFVALGAVGDAPGVVAAASVSLAALGKAVYHGLVKQLFMSRLNDTYRVSEADLVAADRSAMQASNSLWDKAVNILRGGQQFQSPLESGVEDRSHQVMSR